MALSAFADGKRPPDAAALAAALGRSAAAWRRLVADVARDHAPLAAAWRFGGARTGWTLRLVRGERVVLYLTPQAGCFLAGVVLGEKAARAADARGEPAAVRAAIAAAPRYAEGRGIRLTVTRAAEAAVVRRLVALKLGT